MKNVTRFAALAIASAVIVGDFGIAAAQQRQFVNIGTAGVGGGYYPAGGFICAALNRSREKLNHNIRCTVEATAGSVANMRAIRSGDLEIAFAQSDWQYHAYNGSSAFQEAGPNRDLRFMFSLQFDPFHLVARDAAGVRGFQDLKGKVVNTGNAGSGHESTLKMVFGRYGWDPAQVFRQEAKLTSREQSAALCDNKIDAFLFPAGMGAASVSEATNTCAARVINWDDEVIAKMLADLPYFAMVDIPPNIYRGQTTPVRTWGVQATLVATTRLPEQVAYTIAKSVFDNFDEFVGQSNIFIGVTKEGAVSAGKSAPYHPGTEKFFREVGLLK